MSQFHKLNIKSVEKVTSKSVAVTFEIPEALSEAFSFKAGQYITIKKVNYIIIVQDHKALTTIPMEFAFFMEKIRDY